LDIEVDLIIKVCTTTILLLEHAGTTLTYATPSYFSLACNEPA